jgi:hypothetical protein
VFFFVCFVFLMVAILIGVRGNVISNGLFFYFLISVLWYRRYFDFD